MSEKMLRHLIEAAAILLVAIVAAFVAKRLLTVFAKRLDKSEANVADDLLRSMRMPAVVLILLAGIYAAMARIPNLHGVIRQHKDAFEVVGAMAVLIGLTNAVNIGVSGIPAALPTATTSLTRRSSGSSRYLRSGYWAARGCYRSAA